MSIGMRSPYRELGGAEKKILEEEKERETALAQGLRIPAPPERLSAPAWCVGYCALVGIGFDCTCSNFTTLLAGAT
jgi:hypothetical protein